MNSSDRIVLYQMFGVKIDLSPDGERLIIRGDQQHRDIARPSIMKHRAALIAELKRQRTTTREVA